MFPKMLKAPPVRSYCEACSIQWVTLMIQIAKSLTVCNLFEIKACHPVSFKDAYTTHELRGDKQKRVLSVTNIIM